MNLEQRLTALERTVRLQRAALLVIGLGAGVVALVGAAADKEIVADTVRARSFVLDDGKVKGIFGIGKDGNTHLSLGHVDDETRILMHASQKGSLVSMSTTDKSVLLGTDARSASIEVQNKGVGRAFINAGEGTLIEIIDGKDVSRIAAFCTPIGESAIAAKDRNGKTVWQAP